MSILLKIGLRELVLNSQNQSFFSINYIFLVLLTIQIVKLVIGDWLDIVWRIKNLTNHLYWLRKDKQQSCMRGSERHLVLTWSIIIIQVNQQSRVTLSFTFYYYNLSAVGNETLSENSCILYVYGISFWFWISIDSLHLFSPGISKTFPR